MASLIALLFALSALAAEPAAAGTFHVYGLGLNSAGCPNGYVGHSSGPFQHGNYCSSWEVANNATAQHNQFGVASLFTGAGARFTGFSIRADVDTVNDMEWRVAACSGAFTGCAYPALPWEGFWLDREVSIGTLGGTGSLNATHIFTGLVCAPATTSGSCSGTSRVKQRESHAVVEDYTAPGLPGLSGVSSGWNSGQKTLSYSASDSGSGVEAVTLTVDGSLHRTNSHSCLRLPAGGYQAPVPCVEATGGQFAVNEPGQLADGRHSLVVTSRDAGGAEASSSQEFYVDNNAPTAPLGLAVVGGDGWRGTNDYSVTWENPDQGSGSPIAGAYYKIGSAPTTPEDGTRVAADGLSRFDGLNVPHDGSWTLYVWLRDAAGNALHGSAASVQLRLDTTPPSLAFDDERNEHEPAQVRVHSHDVTSGVAGGQIDIRRQGVAEWRPLETRLEGTELVATIPDEQLERGTYELQATAWDVVGNRATTSLRADGKAMVVDVPLRGDTNLNASLARGAEGSGRALPSIKVGYRKAAWLRGILRSGSGAPLPDTRVFISTRPVTGGEWQPLTELLTDGSGRYAVKLEAGGSREIRVHFPGTRSLRPANDVAKLLVRGWASLKLRPKRLRRGRTITFGGHVGLLGALVPATGKLIQIQYLDGRKWRPAVKLGRTDDQGKFAIRYRFQRISRPTKIFFRILVPAEAGWPYVTGTSKTRIARVRP